jgi:putative flavoprotein involved in K+ transport
MRGRPARTYGRPMTEHCETIVIGAGQAGLSVGHHLARRGRDFLILEASERVGDVWRRRFDSLRLYSPASYDGLPGWGVPLPRWHYPTKDELADYLETYAERFELPVITGAPVEHLGREGEGYVVRSGPQRFTADNVVVASGTFQEPIVPGFAPELDPRILQLHSTDYRNPAQLQDGPVLVVGCSHSGADVALDVVGTHETLVAGPVRGEIPWDIEGDFAHRIMPLLWLVANHVLSVRTPLGRKARRHIRAHGAPLLRVKRKHLDAAGVTRAEARVTGVEGGRPVLADGRVLDVANVIWCTGFTKDVSWIDFPVAGPDGWPEQDRGVAPQPGLYFVGLPFLFAFASMLVGGVGRDAERVAGHIAERMEALAGERAMAPA